MCGILGFFDTEQNRDRPAMHEIGRAMGRALAHRGPDGEGLWQDPDAPLLLGHRRLSILDLSPEGHQPMESRDGRYVIVFNGEIYNYRDLQAELEQEGAKFRGRSDTEVMLAAFERWGINLALQKLNGMFAFALWDKKERTLHLVRDRLGKKPLYAGWAGKSLVFASELKAFRVHPDFRPEIDRGAVALYMRFAFIPAPYSIYGQVWQLLPGTRLALKLDEVKAGKDLSVPMEPYWSPAEAVMQARNRPPPRYEEEAVADFESLLKDCVRERMVSDVPLGAFLSGGLDSTAVVALMQQFSPQPVKTFCVGFREAGFDEAAHARAVAKHLGTEHHEMYLSARDAMDVIPKIPDMFDEPFADASQIPTYMVAHFARRHVTVALSGDGGDEMLGGYTRYLVAPQMWKRIGWMPLPVRKAMSAAFCAMPVRALNRLAPQHPRFGEKLHKTAEFMAMDDVQEAYATLAGHWLRPENLVLGSKERPVPLHNPSWQPAGLNFAEQLIYNDTICYLPNDILTKVDRATMAVSLEARAPLLDRRIFEYVWTLPLSMKIRDGQGKWLLRQALKKYVPADMFDRPKQGFSVPVGEWLAGPLRDWAESLLNEGRLRQEGFLDPAMARLAWADHLEGRGSHPYRLWNILMFQSWLQRWR